MKKKIATISLSILLSLVFSVSAFADPEDAYIEETFDDSASDMQNNLLSEELSEETEHDFESDFRGNDLLPEMEEVELTDGENLIAPIEDGMQVNVVPLTDRITYVSETQMYVYSGSSGDELLASVMDESLVSYAVYLDLGENSSYKLYKDGSVYDIPDDHLLRSFGSYAVMKEHNGVQEMCYSFRIIPEVTNDLAVYQMPVGFRINSVSKDGEIIDSEESFVSFTEEGAYTVQYECPYIQRAFTFEVSIDRSAPELLLPEVNEKGFASKPVDISDRGATDKLTIVVNGKEIKEPSDLKLRDVGNYEVTVSDKAGNSSSYSFVIRPYVNISATVAFIILGVIVLGIVGFVIYSRKFVRVR